MAALHKIKWFIPQGKNQGSLRTKGGELPAGISLCISILLYLSNYICRYLYISLLHIYIALYLCLSPFLRVANGDPGVFRACCFLSHLSMATARLPASCVRSALTPLLPTGWWLSCAWAWAKGLLWGNWPKSRRPLSQARSSCFAQDTRRESRKRVVVKWKGATWGMWSSHVNNEQRTSYPSLCTLSYHSYCQDPLLLLSS